MCIFGVRTDHIDAGVLGYCIRDVLLLEGEIVMKLIKNIM